MTFTHLNILLTDKLPEPLFQTLIIIVQIFELTYITYLGTKSLMIAVFLSYHDDLNNEWKQYQREYYTYRASAVRLCIVKTGVKLIIHCC